MVRNLHEELNDVVLMAFGLNSQVLQVVMSKDWEKLQYGQKEAISRSLSNSCDVLVSRLDVLMTAIETTVNEIKWEEVERVIELIVAVRDNLGYVSRLGVDLDKKLVEIKKSFGRFKERRINPQPRMYGDEE